MFFFLRTFKLVIYITVTVDDCSECYRELWVTWSGNYAVSLQNHWLQATWDLGLLKIY